MSGDERADTGASVAMIAGERAQGAALAAARAALAGQQAWLVGGVVRDRMLGRATIDIDVAVSGDPAAAARAIADAAGRAACFALSEDFGSWRVVSREHGWQVDVEPLRAPTVEQDLALRDFTANAIAEPLAGGERIDPLGGLEDLRKGRLRMAGPDAFAADPLRVLRLVRVAIELALEPDARTLASARAAAAGLPEVAGERVFMELRRIVASPQAHRGVEMLAEVGAGVVVLPELEALRGVEQNRFHHADVYDHTLETLDWVIALGDAVDLGVARGGNELDALIDGHRAEIAALLAEPLADEMTRGEALRWGALLHDCAKPLTRAEAGGGRVTFLGHDVRGAQLAREVLTRLRASERMRGYVAALVRSHLRLGFLVHEQQPLPRRCTFAYMRACAPVEVDVTLLSAADRLATRGERSKEAIAAHLRLAAEVLPDALRWRALGAPEPPLRGDELADELGIARGPQLGRLLEELREAIYAGELHTREEAVDYARGMLDSV